MADPVIVFDRAGLAELFESTDGAVAKELQKRALQVTRRAKALAPVDTGRLRSSIDNEIRRDAEGLVAVIGSDVEYAAHVELGTQHTRPQPYLRPALGSGE